MGPHMRDPPWKSVKEHDMHIEPKSWKLKLLEKLVAQYDVRAWFAGARGFEDVSLCLPCF